MQEDQEIEEEDDDGIFGDEEDMPQVIEKEGVAGLFGDGADDDQEMESEDEIYEDDADME